MKLRLPSISVLLAAGMLLPNPSACALQVAPAPAAPHTFLPDPESPALDWNTAWPARWMPQHSTLRGVVVPVLQPAGLLGVRTNPLAELPTPHDQTDSAALAKLFYLPAEPTWETEGRNSTPVEVAREKVTFLRTGEPDASLVFRFVSGRAGPAGVPLTVSLDRTTFALYDATDAPATHLVVLLPGMLGTPEQVLEPLILHLRTRGCSVLRMFAHPARTTQAEKLKIDPEHENSIADTGKRLAEIYNDRIAECAYSVEAALDYVRTQRTSLSTLPVVAIAASGGAVMLPTVCALHPEQWAGAILIGGGVDFWLISERSNYRNLVNAVKVTWTRPPTEAEDAALDREYLQHARLDPFHTATSLRDIPMFIIRGELDRAVPAPLGAMLTQRIRNKRPESQESATPIGHESLFITLPARFDEISTFVKARTAPPSR